MSHFVVLVTGENVEEQLAPFQENNMGDCPSEYLSYLAYPKGSWQGQWFRSPEEAQRVLGEAYDEDEAHWENPKSKWDWYQVGGRWSGYFKLKPGSTGSLGTPGIFGNTAEPGRADSLLLKDIDFEGPRQEARNSAVAHYDEAHAILRAHGIPDSHHELLAQGMSQDDVDKHYWKQPAIKALMKAGLVPEGSIRAHYEVSLEVFQDHAAQQVYVPYAILHQGIWWQAGAPDTEAKAAGRTWSEFFHALLAELPQDTRITAVDCHI